MFTAIGLTSAAFSVYMPFLISNYGFSNTQTSTLTTIRSLVAFVVMFGITKYYDIFNIRVGTGLAALSAAVAFFIFSTSSNYMLCSAAACFMGIAYGLGGMVPITMVINRWFDTSKATALSICSAGSGIASMVCPPVITRLIEAMTLSHAFFLEACFVIGVAALVFLFMKNNPSTEVSGQAAAKKSKTGGMPDGHSLPKSGVYMIMFACVLMGALSVAGWAHMAVLFKSSGYSSMSVAYALSFAGLTLTIGKFAYGMLTDKLKTFRSNFLYFALILAGMITATFAATGAEMLPFITVSLMGIGMPISTIGVSLWATDLSDNDNMAKNVKRFQMSYVFGSLLFNSVPGMIADMMGSYVPAYQMFAVFTVLCCLIVQMVYVKQKRSLQATEAMAAKE